MTAKLSTGVDLKFTEVGQYGLLNTIVTLLLLTGVDAFSYF